MFKKNDTKNATQLVQVQPESNGFNLPSHVSNSQMAVSSSPGFFGKFEDTGKGPGRGMKSHSQGPKSFRMRREEIFYQDDGSATVFEQEWSGDGQAQNTGSVNTYQGYPQAVPDLPKKFSFPFDWVCGFLMLGGFLGHFALHLF